MFVSKSNEMLEKSGLNCSRIYMLIKDTAAMKIDERAYSINTTNEVLGTLKAGSIITEIKVQDSRFLVNELSEDFVRGRGIRLVQAGRFAIPDLSPSILTDITDEVEKIAANYEDDYFEVIKTIQSRLGRHYFRRSQKLITQKLEDRLDEIEKQVKQEYRELRRELYEVHAITP